MVTAGDVACLFLITQTLINFSRGEQHKQRIINALKEASLLLSLQSEVFIKEKIKLTGF